MPLSWVKTKFSDFRSQVLSELATEFEAEVSDDLVEALAAASTQLDLKPFDTLLAALRQPYDEDPARAAYAQPAPAQLTAGYRTFCGT